MSNVKDKIEQLMAKEEEILALALAKALKAVNEKPITENIRDYESAKKAIEAFRKKKNNGDTLQNILEAVDYLKSQGWKIEKSKAYDDQRLMKPQKDGTFLKAELDKYAERFLKKMDGSNSDIGYSVDKKLLMETEVLKEKVKKLKRENEVEAGLYILRSDVEQMFASRAAYLKEGLGISFISVIALECINILKGDKDKIPEFIDFYLKEINKIFDYYSKPLRFEVPERLLKREIDV